MATVLITGANRGLGLTLTHAHLDAGDEVLACARDRADLVDLPTETFALDLADDDSIGALAQALEGRPIDVLINNAGILGADDDRHGPRFGDLRRPALVKTLEINAVAQLLLTQALYPSLAAGERRTIINMSSNLGSIERTQSPEPYAYRASKAALNMITRCLACEPRLAGFIVVAVHPGWIRTRMGGDQAPLSPEDAAGALQRLFGSLTHDHHAKLIDPRGQTIPW